MIINRELDGLKRDKRGYELELQNHQRNLLESLKGEMGKDIDNVLSGKVKVKTSFWQKIKYKIKYFLERLFNTI